MKNDTEKSYERYKQYRRNKYRYEQEQIIFPIAVILGLAVLIGLWKYIFIAIASIVFIGVIGLGIYFYFNKQIKAEQHIVLTKKDAIEGVEVKVNVTYNAQRVSFIFDIPSNVKDGQKFVAKNISFRNRKGKTIKKNVHFKVQVL